MSFPRELSAQLKKVVSRGHKLLELTDRTECFMIHPNVKLKLKYTGLSRSLWQESAKNMNRRDYKNVIAMNLYCFERGLFFFFFEAEHSETQSFLSKYGIKDRGIFQGAEH